MHILKNECDKLFLYFSKFIIKKNIKYIQLTYNYIYISFFKRIFNNCFIIKFFFIYYFHIFHKIMKLYHKSIFEIKNKFDILIFVFL